MCILLLLLLLCIIISIIFIIIIIYGCENKVATAIIFITYRPRPIVTSRWRLMTYKYISVSSRLARPTFRSRQGLDRWRSRSPTLVSGFNVSCPSLAVPSFLRSDRTHHCDQHITARQAVCKIYDTARKRYLQWDPHWHSDVYKAIIIVANQWSRCGMWAWHIYTDIYLTNAVLLRHCTFGPVFYPLWHLHMPACYRVHVLTWLHLQGVGLLWLLQHQLTYRKQPYIVLFCVWHNAFLPARC